MLHYKNTRRHILASLVALMLLNACNSPNVRRATEEENLTVEDKRDRRGGKIGREGKPDDKPRKLFSFGKKKNKAPNTQNTIVNARQNTNVYLWQGALETINFMPLLSSDFNGGVIATDWYSPPEKPAQRYKITVRIIGPDFRSDALSVNVFSQRLRGSVWRNEDTDKDTVRKIEDTMLTRARDLIADAKL